MRGLNIVELVADDDDCAFDQPCLHGNRVESHAVYCHNERWPQAPRKCRRSWYTGGKDPDWGCPGFAPNPDYDGVKYGPIPHYGGPDAD